MYPPGKRLKRSGPNSFKRSTNSGHENRVPPSAFFGPCGYGREKKPWRSHPLQSRISMDNDVMDGSRGKGGSAGRAEGRQGNASRKGLVMGELGGKHMMVLRLEKDDNCNC